MATLDKRAVRWTLATILTAAAAIDAYLALSAKVWWPIPLALVWIGFAAALLVPPLDVVEVREEKLPRTAREALALADLAAHRPAHV
ncbi:hypothetical protein [Actinokineospora inagensis]|uniref:hypothetical protein n=1 Tax=Actinokineospora inagensis TaxID=103730 RepID=UPI000420F6B8|nr:hypothetical protein [Actinokineospora inagensis]